MNESTDSVEPSTHLPHLTCLQVAEKLQAIAAQHGDMPVRMMIDPSDDHATVVEGPALLYDENRRPYQVVWLMSGDSIFFIQG